MWQLSRSHLGLDSGLHQCGGLSSGWGHPRLWPGRLPRALLPLKANGQGSHDASWLGQGQGSSPCHAEAPIPISLTHLVCLPHPSIVSNVLPKCAEAVHLHTGDRMAGSTPTGVGRGLGGASGGRGAPRAGSRSAAPPAPRSSSRTGGSCTPTASGSAGPRSCSTSPACCRSCRSSGLGGDRGGLSGLPCLSSGGPQ